MEKPTFRLIALGLLFLAMSLMFIWFTLVPNEGASHPGDFHIERTQGKSILSWDVIVFGLLGFSLVLKGLWNLRNEDLRQ